MIKTFNKKCNRKNLKQNELWWQNICYENENLWWKEEKYYKKCLKKQCKINKMWQKPNKCKEKRLWDKKHHIENSASQSVTYKGSIRPASMGLANILFKTRPGHLNIFLNNSFGDI